MPAIYKTILYGLGVFSIFACLTYILRLVSNKMPENAEFFGVYTSNDLLLGVLVAVFLTFTHERKKKLKK